MSTRYCIEAISNTFVRDSENFQLFSIHVLPPRPFGARSSLELQNLNGSINFSKIHRDRRLLRNFFLSCIYVKQNSPWTPSWVHDVPQIIRIRQKFLLFPVPRKWLTPRTGRGLGCVCTSRWEKARLNKASVAYYNGPTDTRVYVSEFSARWKAKIALKNSRHTIFFILYIRLLLIMRFIWKKLSIFLENSQNGVSNKKMLCKIYYSDENLLCYLYFFADLFFSFSALRLFSNIVRRCVSEDVFFWRVKNIVKMVPRLLFSANF